MLEQFLKRAMESGCVKQTEIKCTRCGEVDHTMMAMGQPATMAGKFTNLSVSIEMKCACGYEFELSYANGEFKQVQNPTLVAFDGVEDDDEDRNAWEDNYYECDEGGHGDNCCCFEAVEDNLPVRMNPLATAFETEPKKKYADW